VLSVLSRKRETSVTLRGAGRGARKIASSIFRRAEAGGLFAQHPADGIGDVRLAAPVGADDGSDPGFEFERDGVSERFEP
jgi:hypothetical protein